MRKFHNILLFLTTCVLLNVSCYEDKSKLLSLDIPAVTITVPEAIAESLSVVHGKVLSVEGIQIARGGDTNPQGLTYEWTVSETKNDPEIQLLATTKDFNEKIDLPINSSGYLFVLTVKDALYDTKYQYQWRLYVTAQYGEGVVVAYTKDGVSGDLGIIMHPKLTKQFSGTAIETYKDLIKSRNGSAIPSPITHVLYTFVKGSAQNMLWVATKDDLMRVETDYYEILGHKDDIFVYAPEGVGIEAIRNTYQCTMFINKGKIYEGLLSYTQISAPATGSETMAVDQNVISAHAAPSYSRQPSTIFYDAVKEKFCYGRNTTFRECMNVTTGSFPTGKLSGKRSRVGGVSVDGTTHCLLLEDIASGNHAIYSFTNTSSTAEPPAKILYTLPATVNEYIKNASALFFSEKEPILYIARGDKIYVLVFESGAVSFDPGKPVFTAPAGETITIAKLYMQGYYAAENYAANATLEWNSRAVIVVTSKGDNNDKVHVVPQINFGSGMLDQSQAIVCDGFGKITGVTVAGLAK